MKNLVVETKEKISYNMLYIETWRVVFLFHLPSKMTIQGDGNIEAILNGLSSNQDYMY